MRARDTQSGSRKPRALVLYGGWEGHTPQRAAEFASKHIFQDYAVVRSQDLDMLRDDVLAEFDLLAPIWTFGDITDSQEKALLGAVANGLGVLAWHGALSAFLASRPHKLLLGGQFVAHPGGAEVAYTVRFHGNDPLVAGLPDTAITTEQYYLLVDPAVKVLASTCIEGGEWTWLANVEMPVVWTRQWGAGKVFYCSLGHTVDLLRNPTVLALFRRAARWAVRDHSRADASMTLNVGPARTILSTTNPAARKSA